MLEAHWEPSQTSKNKISEKTVMSLKPSTVFPEAPHQTVAFGWAGIWMHPWILLSMKFLTNQMSFACPKVEKLTLN